MSLYKNVINALKSNKEKRRRGEIISIPWENLPKLSKVLPGIIPENFAIVTANQKVGKTQLADYLYVYSPIDYLFTHPEASLDVDIQYFSLEMSKEAKMRQAIAYRLFTKYGVTISPQDLRSVFNDYILEDEIEELIDAEQEWLDFFESRVTFEDSVRNPYGIHLAVKNKCESEGKYEYTSVEWHEGGKTTTKVKRDKYVPDDPNKIQIVIVDHASLISPERGGTLYEAIGKLSSEYILEMRDLWKCQICLVQQQTPTSESQQYTMIGGTILDKVRPTPDNLGYNKSTAQDCNLMLSLFHPQRYRQKKYNGIDLEQMDDSHRELAIPLNRDGINNAYIDLYFNGAVNYFEEVDRDNLDKVYDKVNKFRDKRYKR